MAAQSTEELLTPAEVAALFRVDPKTVTRWAQAGKLSTIRTLGGHRRFRAAEIRELLWTPGSEFANQLVHSTPVASQGVELEDGRSVRLVQQTKDAV